MQDYGRVRPSRVDELGIKRPFAMRTPCRRDSSDVLILRLGEGGKASCNSILSEETPIRYAASGGPENPGLGSPLRPVERTMPLVHRD